MLNKVAVMWQKFPLRYTLFRENINHGHMACSLKSTRSIYTTAHRIHIIIHIFHELTLVWKKIKKIKSQKTGSKK